MLNKGGGGILGKFFGENPKNVGSPYSNIVVQVVSKIIWSISSMFSTVFIDISLIFVQLSIENFGKIVTSARVYPEYKKCYYY